VLNGSATKWKFVDKTGAPANGLRSVIVQDRSTKATDLVAVKVKGKNGTYPVVAGDEPLSVALELQGSTLCAVLPFAADDCGFNAVGDKLSCVRK
jgi:hypothetical protein